MTTGTKEKEIQCKGGNRIPLANSKQVLQNIIHFDIFYGKNNVTQELIYYEQLRKSNTVVKKTESRVVVSVSTTNKT